MLTVFDVRGAEISRQSPCDQEITRSVYGEAATACSIAAKEMSLEANRAGGKDILVRSTAADIVSSHPNRRYRYRLVNGRFVAQPVAGAKRQ